jgi:hypothetical protein
VEHQEAGNRSEIILNRYSYHGRASAFVGIVGPTDTNPGLGRRFDRVTEPRHGRFTFE